MNQKKDKLRNLKTAIEVAQKAKKLLDLIKKTQPIKTKLSQSINKP